VTITGKTITENDRALVETIQARADSGQLGQGEQRMLHYALGKAYDDLGEYEQAMKNYDLANQLSQARLNAAGRRFDPDRFHAQAEATIQKFGPNFFQNSKGLGVETERPVFIVGMPRSGTTLLEQIVSSHPEVSAAGELGGWPAMTAGPFQSAETTPTKEEVQAIANEFLTRLEKAAKPAPYTTEKSPQNYMILGPILAAFPNAHILHCRRNAVDTCLSIYTTSFMSGPDFAHDRQALVTAYKEYARVMNHWNQVLPKGHLLNVQYEDLVNGREPQIRRILDFLGLEWNEACMRHEQNDHAISTPSLWQARQPVFNRSVGRWRNYEPWLGPLRELVEQK
jgi:tetratricopeptide (TPR) repeat protein